MLTNETYLSNIYNKIMKNYDKKFRPNFSGNATNVFLDIQILSFSDIDERSMVIISFLSLVSFGSR